MITPENEIHVLYLDNEQHNLNSFTATFRKSFKIFTSTSLETAETICIANQIHVLIIDQYLLTKSGIQLPWIAIKYSHESRILLTTFTDINLLEAALKNGYIHQYFQKPWNERKLRKAIEEGYILYNQRQKK